MLFHSPIFLILLFGATLTFWGFIYRIKPIWQNLFLLALSYFFYGFWDARFLILIAVSTGVDFVAAKVIEKATSPSRKKGWLYFSLFMNLGLLAVFKYYNFFIESLVESMSILGLNLEIKSLSLILPVGISFYTFQTLSYTIDVYKNKIRTSNSIIEFAAFVSFFPQLVAGPIERASELLHQFKVKKEFSSARIKVGLKLFLMGLFKKIVIADTAAAVADKFFVADTSYAGITLFIGILMFSIQIYGDFSGYSDMARGIALLFGFKLVLNFNFPYFSNGIIQFWQRWHISLGRWFKDYIYLPLGGRKKKLIRNIWIVFLLSGLWHGANWTFIVWGAWHASFWTLEFFIRKFKLFAIIPTSIKMGATFLVVVLGWVWFRSPSLEFALNFFFKMLDGFRFAWTYAQAENFWRNWIGIWATLAFIIFFLFEGVFHYRIKWWFKLYANRPFRWSFYLVAAYLIILNAFHPSPFIYFQF